MCASESKAISSRLIQFVFNQATALETQSLPANMGSLVIVLSQTVEANPEHLCATCMATWVRDHKAVTCLLCAKEVKADSLCISGHDCVEAQKCLGVGYCPLRKKIVLAILAGTSHIRFADSGFVRGQGQVEKPISESRPSLLFVSYPINALCGTGLSKIFSPQRKAVGSL